MGLERFGRVSFTTQAKVSDFVDYLEKEGLHATQCRACGLSFFPPRADCSFCLSSEMEWFKLKDEGRLLTFTRSRFGPTGFEEDVPYVLAVADFDDIKVFGRFNAAHPEEELAIGMKVRVETLSLPGGHVSYEFVPA